MISCAFYCSIVPNDKEVIEMSCSNGCRKYPNMFKPMTIRGKTWKNRVIASPITANRIVDHGYPTPEGIDAYETKSRGGFAQVTVTESFVDHEYAWRHEHGLNVWENPMTTFHMESIMTLTEAIKAHGAIAMVQLNHVGAMNHPDTIPGHKNPIGPSAFVRDDGVSVEKMTKEQIEYTVNQLELQGSGLRRGQSPRWARLAPQPVPLAQV